MTPAVYGSLVGPLESSRSTILGAPLPRRAVLRSFTQTLQPGKMRQQGAVLDQQQPVILMACRWLRSANLRVA